MNIYEQFGDQKYDKYKKNGDQKYEKYELMNQYQENSSKILGGFALRSSALNSEDRSSTGFRTKQIGLVDIQAIRRIKADQA